MSSFYFKTKKRMIAWICAITMVVAGLAVAPKTVVADEEAGTTAVDWSNITEWTRVGETDIYYSITNTKGMFNKVNVVNSELFYFIVNRGDFEATITGPKTDNVVEKKCAGAEIELKKSDFPTDGYYTIDTTKLDGLQIAVKRDSSGGGEVSAPKAPTGLEAHIGGGNTFYTIAFAPVDGAKSYKFYLDGKCIKEITNGGTVTIEELGLKAGKTYKFGVSAVNAAGVESGITTIDVKVPGNEEGTTPTPEYKDGEVLVNESNRTEVVPECKDKKNEYEPEYKHVGIKYVQGKKYVAEVVVSSTAAKRIGFTFQKNGGNWDFVNADNVHYVDIAAGNKVKITYVFESKMSVDDGIFDIYLGCNGDATTLVFESKKLTTYSEVPEGVQTGVEVLEAPGTTKYTVSIDGTEKQYEEGATIAVPADGQGYYNVTKKEAYAPGTELTVNENMTLKSIKLSVTMTKGASIRLAAPTGLRFQTTVESGNGIAVDDILDLKTGTVTTGTLITTLDLYTTNGKTLTKDSTYAVLNIANAGWFGEESKKETGKFCGSIIKIQRENYGRKFIAVGYATINYSNGKSKTVYANVTENNAKSIKYVAEKVQASDKFSGYSPEQQAIINKYIKGEEISK